MKDFDKSFLFKLRLVMSYHDVLRNHFKPVSRCYFNKFRQSQQKAARKLQGKERLEVAFFLTIPGMWKSDELFRAMLDDKYYHPYIVIYPYSIYKEFDSSEMLKTVERTKSFIEKKGYEYVIPYDEGTQRWYDLKEIRTPDVVFFSTPYKDSLPIYYVSHYRDTLTCYVPYGFCSLKLNEVNYNMMFHNLVGIYCLETEIHQRLAIQYSRNKGVNTVVTGYPATEVFFREDYVPQNQWKPQSHTKKRVIYAPHHSIDKSYYPSVFLETCEEILQIAEKYADSIQFVFKPHQTLKFKLQQVWGVERTEEFYERWDRLENAQLVSDGYVDLFMTSDAMIHDCGSFTTEYLFVQKPVMYLCRNTDMASKFNEFGQKSFECHYHGTTGRDVEDFLQRVVLDGDDPMKECRERFYEEFLRPKDGVLPSRKILKVLDEAIKGK